MAYIGKEPIVGNFQKCDAITVVNGQAAYTLQVSSTNVVPESSSHMLVSLNGILQAPVTSFTVSGSTLTFASNLATGDVIDLVILLGNVLDIGTPSDGTVTNAKLASDVISGETDIGGAIADADLFLMDDGAGGTLRKTAASRIKTYVGSGLSEVHQWRLTTSFSGGSASPIASNWEVADSYGYGGIGSGMTQSSGVFTFPSTGIWLIKYNVAWKGNSDGDVRYAGGFIKTSTNAGSGDTYNETAGLYASAEDPSDHYHESAGGIMTIFDVTNTTTHKVRFQFATHNSNIDCYGDTNSNLTTVVFMKLGDT